MRILICGTREDVPGYISKIEKVIKKLNPKNDIIIYGGCKGVDITAGSIAKRLNFVVEEYPADWKKYGKEAGPIRNAEMLATGIDKVIAFHPNINESKGTLDMVNRARKHCVHTVIYGGEKIIVYRYE